MARERKRQIKRERSPGAALGESAPTTPHVGPRLDGGGHAHGHGEGDEEHSSGILGIVGEGDEQESSSRLQSTEEAIEMENEERTGREGVGVNTQTECEWERAPSPILPSTQVTINVGGRLFTTYAGTLCKEPSLLSLDVLSYFKHTLKDENGIPFYDRDPDNFSHILNFLRGYPLMLNAEEAKHLAQDALYFDIKGLRQATGADPSLINWRYQPGPGVSADRKSFHSTEIVSLIGAGPLLPGETSVVFFRIEKHSQLTIGLVPPDIPLDQNFVKLPNTICLDSTSGVSCSILSYPSVSLPDVLSEIIPKMLVHDLCAVMGASATALQAYGLDAANTAVTSRPSPSLLAVSNGPASQANEDEEPELNSFSAPVLSAEVTASWRPSTHFVNGNTEMTTGVASPFVMPQQQPLQPMRTNGSQQPSMLPPMPSPLIQGQPASYQGAHNVFDPAGPSPALGPTSIPNTPYLLPITNNSSAQHTADAIAPQAASAPQQLSTSGLRASRVIDDPSILDRLPILFSTVCPTSASVPRLRDGDEVCVVSHLSEDGTVAVVRFYRGEQLLHVVVGFGPLRPGGNAHITGLNEDHPRHLVPLPPLQLALYARSSTTVVTSDARTIKKENPNNARGGQRQSLPTPSSGHPQAPQMTDQRAESSLAVLPTTPLAVITSALQEQQFRSHEAQFHSLLHLFPEMVGRIAAAVGASPQDRGNTVNHREVLNLLVHTIADTVRHLVQAQAPVTSSGFFEYFLALPRFYNVPIFDEDYLLRLLASPQNTSTSGAMLFPLSNNIQSVLATTVRSIALSDNDISAMTRRQNASAMGTVEQLEAKRQGALSVVAALASNNRRGFSGGSASITPTRAQELVHFLLPETHLFWERIGANTQNSVVPRAGQVLSGDFIAFRSAREMLEES